MSQLIPCRVCGYRISSGAKACPRCGDANIKQSMQRYEMLRRKAKEEERRRYEEQLRRQEEARRYKEESEVMAEHFSRLPVETRIYKYIVEDTLGFQSALFATTATLPDKRVAIVETFHDDGLKYKVLRFNKSDRDLYYQYVSKEEFEAYGGTVPGFWERLFL